MPLTDVTIREPRCRICRDETVRVLVNDLLPWRGVPIVVESRAARPITLADIYRFLEPVNRERDQRSRITYASLWNHAKRHYELAGVATRQARRIDREIRRALGGYMWSNPTGQVQNIRSKYKE